jgi:hypothetical protein
LTLQSTSIGVNTALDDLACNLADHQRHVSAGNTCPPGGQHCIRHNYGLRPFKCPFVGCKWQQLGFEDPKLRKVHSSTHDKAWKCDVETCEYSEIGFLSRKMRDVHSERIHGAGDLGEDDEYVAPCDDQCRRMQVMLALVRTDQVRQLESLIHSGTDMNPADARTLLTEMASSGSYAMLDALGHELLNFGKTARIELEGELKETLLLPAIKSINIEATKWIRHHFLKLYDGTWRRSFGVVMSTLLRSEDAQRLYENLEPLIVGRSSYATWNASFERSSIAATQGCPRRERVLMQIWQTLKERPMIEASDFTKGLWAIAATTCSLNLASMLLDFGANIEGLPNRSRPNPLQRAAQHNSEAAAAFMRYLLYRGANPDISYEKRLTALTESNETVTVHISEEKGVKEISKFLDGKQWEELVREAQDARKDNDNPVVPGG